MLKPNEPEFDSLHRAAVKATEGWSSIKSSMALRASGLDDATGKRNSLDSIAADFGVSRETVRRARNELLRSIEVPSGMMSDAVYSVLSLPVPSGPSANLLPTARALRRLLTITGPLRWDDVVSAWARAGGKAPYTPLPADIATMREWALEAGGFTVSTSGEGSYSVIVAATFPEDLDPVSQFLLEAMRGRPGGVARSELLDHGEKVGLRRTTIATTLSTHPAVTRVGRGMWALRGQHNESSSGNVMAPRLARRARPTSFVWGADGSLMIEFSVSTSPSPVVAVPRAVSEIIEGREFRMDTDGVGAGRVNVRNARLWGFGSLLSELRVPVGTRAVIALNLITSRATITTAEGRAGLDD